MGDLMTALQGFESRNFASTGSWVSYPIAWTASVNPTIGNGTLIGRFMRIGGFALVHVEMTAGSTTTFGSGDWSFSLPVNAASTYGSYHVLGSAYIGESGVNDYHGLVHTNSTAVDSVVVTYGSAGLQVIDSAQPFTWGTNDFVMFSFTYEAA